MNRSFSVILVPQPDGGFFVECPGLPGCYSQGDTLDEALANIREAISLVLEDLAELGEPIPEPSPPLLTEVLVDV
ncbi:MAG: type II toxin-antitoxin system HicB family antitoxin [Planctomycetes bacterium]|nr:type II toxin-antitoxin system HicB family antitoxin [Planctomycetota bacterium]